MKNFDIHTVETAEASAAALRAYISLGKIFDESSFSATERQLIILAASRINECKYCIAAHTVVAGMQKVPANVVEAIRENRPIRDERLEALRTFTTSPTRLWMKHSNLQGGPLERFTATNRQRKFPAAQLS
jgi:AhpD family alkylhydroperoxidase